MSAAPRKLIAADAAFDEVEKIAGVGIGFPDQVYGIVRSNIVPAESISEAECKAITNGLDYLSSCDLPAGSRVLNDSRHVVEIINGERANNGRIEALTLTVARGLKDAYGYEVVCCKRNRAKAAHRAARISLMAWRKGRRAAVNA